MTILGPVMIPNLKILRFHEEIGQYHLVVSAKVIAQYRERFHKNGADKNFKLSHEEIVTGVTMTDSFIITKENRKTQPENFRHLPYGTWMIQIDVTEELYKRIQELGLQGFSIEGKFPIQGKDGKTIIVTEAFRLMNKLSDILPFEVHVFGGSTAGAGRNEHGDAHFQIKERNTRKDLGKIYMPKLDDWKKWSQKDKVNFITGSEGVDIKTKEKKTFVTWLSSNNNENLIRCHNQWNESNKDNNRVTLI